MERKVEVVTPSTGHLESYVQALRRGWSPDSTRGQVAAEQELGRISADPDAFLASLDDREGRGDPVMLPDGTRVQRLPGIVRWMWDGEFAGMVGFRWQRGTAELPPTCLGHIGFNVPPEKRNRGHATFGLKAMLSEARGLDMPYVELTTRPDNAASRRVIEKAGGHLVEQLPLPPEYGEGEFLRFRIRL